MRRFLLVRTDGDGVVDRGVVAEGVVFSFGKTIICWTVEPRTVTSYDKFSDMASLQAKNGRTHIQWIDTNVSEAVPHSRPASSQAILAALRALEDTSDMPETELGAWPLPSGESPLMDLSAYRKQK